MDSFIPSVGASRAEEVLRLDAVLLPGLGLLAYIVELSPLDRKSKLRYRNVRD